MGNQESSRRVSFENEEPDNIVKVSENVVVELLKQTVDEDKTQEEPKNKSNKNPKKSTKESQETTQSQDDDDLTLLLKKQQHELQQQYETDLERDNAYWESRIKALQESHERINQTWEAEYQKAFEDVENMFGPLPSKDSKTPCSAEKSAVVSCYKKNAAQPLLCSAEVQAFVDCMNGARK